MKKGEGIIWRDRAEILEKELERVKHQLEECTKRLQESKLTH